MQPRAQLPDCRPPRAVAPRRTPRAGRVLRGGLLQLSACGALLVAGCGGGSGDSGGGGAKDDGGGADKKASCDKIQQQLQQGADPEELQKQMSDPESAVASFRAKAEAISSAGDSSGDDDVKRVAGQIASDIEAQADGLEALASGGTPQFPGDPRQAGRDLNEACS